MAMLNQGLIINKIFLLNDSASKCTMLCHLNILGNIGVRIHARYSLPVTGMGEELAVR